MLCSFSSLESVDAESACLFVCWFLQLDNPDEQAAQIRRELDGRLQMADQIARVKGWLDWINFQGWINKEMGDGEPHLSILKNTDFWIFNIKDLFFFFIHMNSLIYSIQVFNN